MKKKLFFILVIMSVIGSTVAADVTPASLPRPNFENLQAGICNRSAAPKPPAAPRPRRRRGKRTDFGFSGRVTRRDESQRRVLRRTGETNFAAIIQAINRLGINN